MDLVARAIGMDPLELRRRNVVSTDELPFTTAMGMELDHVTPAETLEQAAEIIGYDAFRAEQRRAFEHDGRLLGIGIGLYVEPTSMAAGSIGVECATVRVQPSGTVTVLLGHGLARPGRRDDDGAGRRGAPRRVVGRRGRGAGRHRERTLRCRDGRQPHRGRGRRRGARRVARGARPGARDRGPSARGRARRPRRRRRSRLGARHTDPRRHPRGGRGGRVQRAGSASGRAASRPRGDRAVPGTADHVVERVPRVHRRGRSRHRRGHDAALRRERGLRRHDQPDDRGRSDRGRGRAGDRRGALRAPRVRRPGHTAHDDLPRLPRADRDRGSRHRVRPHRDALTDTRRAQGDG